MGETPRVSVLMVSYNTRPVLLEALQSLVDLAGVEVIVVDNASADGSADAVAAHFPGVRLVCSARNLGFAGGTNRAAELARGDNLLLLNPDAAMTREALDRLEQTLTESTRAAAVGPALVYADGRPQAAAFRFPGLVQIALDLFPVDRLTDSRFNGRLDRARRGRIDHPLGACMLIRGTAWRDVGPLDEGYFMYLEEVDWCRRARARGWEIWYEPSAVVLHHGAMATRQRADAMYAQLWRSRLRYYQRFHGPFFNRVVRMLVRVGMRAEARRSGSRRAAPIRELTA